MSSVISYPRRALPPHHHHLNHTAGVVFPKSTLFRSPGSPVPPMARDRPIRCPRQQTRRPRCPYCNKQFSNVLHHLNHRQSKCGGWLDTAAPRYGSPSHHRGHSTEEFMDSTIPDDFSDTQQPPPPHHQPHIQRVEFSGAARVYGQTKTFMDRFNDDKYSGLRATNPYYPFAGKNDWELGSFLLSSGLSMRKIDSFLQLKMVSLRTSRLIATY